MYVGSVKPTLDPITKITKNLNAPGFLQNCAGQQTTQCQGGSRTSSKDQETGSPALARGTSHSERILSRQDAAPKPLSTSCLWAAKRGTGLGESQSIYMTGLRTKASGIVAAAQGAIQGDKKVPWSFIWVSKWLRMDKKPNRSFYTSHFPEMNAMITEKLLRTFTLTHVFHQ